MDALEKRLKELRAANFMWPHIAEHDIEDVVEEMVGKQDPGSVPGVLELMRDHVAADALSVAYKEALGGVSPAVRDLAKAGYIERRMTGDLGWVFIRRETDTVVSVAFAFNGLPYPELHLLPNLSAALRNGALKEAEVKRVTVYAGDIGVDFLKQGVAAVVATHRLEAEWPGRCPVADRIGRMKRSGKYKNL